MDVGVVRGPDPFGNTVHFVGLDNFVSLLRSETYHDSLNATVIFTIAQNLVTIAVALVFAFATDRVIRARGLYKSIILLPYAIAPVIAGAIQAHPYHWNTIGYRSDIEGVTTEKLREHYREGCRRADELLRTIKRQAP